MLIIPSAGRTIRLDTEKVPSVTIRGKGSYTGRKTAGFTITPQELSKMTLSISDMKYSSKPDAYKKAKIVLTDQNGKKLSTKDYQISEWFATCSRPASGEYVSVTLSARSKAEKGSGAYTGSITGSFVIK